MKERIFKTFSSVDIVSDLIEAHRSPEGVIARILIFSPPRKKYESSLAMIRSEQDSFM
ncbi:hypothetical protein X556_0625 [Chlamydia pneumoniae B21]|nr:hypothetical protein X556_0625 [Chlamydia pneumoniae B21]